MSPGGRVQRPWAVAATLLTLALSTVNCDGTESLAWMASTRMDDPAIAPFVEAASRSDRLALGFSPLPMDANVKIERSSPEKTGYDVMLHLSRGNVSHSVAFVRNGSGYRWIQEQEMHEGPREVVSVDGRYKEWIAITYAEGKMPGVKEGLGITYRGPEMSLNRAGLTVNDVKPFIEAWAR